MLLQKMTTRCRQRLGKTTASRQVQAAGHIPSIQILCPRQQSHVAEAGILGLHDTFARHSPSIGLIIDSKGA